MAAEKKVAIGIDLGTTNSCVAYMEGNDVKVIQNVFGEYTTPSCVSFSDKGIKVGRSAEDHLLYKPSNTIRYIKRFMGRLWEDPKIYDDKRKASFKVIEESGRLKIQIGERENENESREFFPEEISALILKEMKKIAENYLSKPVTHAVITVPAHFKDAERKATKAAAEIAGLIVERIINEPTAAALCHRYKKENKTERHICIFDLGGGTFDVTVMTVKNDLFTVKAADGDSHLGGNDFTDNLYVSALKILKEKYNEDLSSEDDVEKRIKLRNLCEEAKKKLSADSDHKILFTNISDSLKNCCYDVSRSQFEDLNKDLFERMMHCLKQSMIQAELEPGMIDDVLLVGGSTRIPKIKSLVESYFGQNKIRGNINPDLAVASGAAILAGFWIDQETFQEIYLADAVSHSLGVSILDKNDSSKKRMSFIIRKNRVLPAQGSQDYTTVSDNQKTVLFSVYEGGSENFKENNLLGEFQVTDVPPLKKGSR